MQNVSRITLAQPAFDEEMAEAALHALQNERFVLGESVAKFEEEFSRYCGSKYGIATASGTAALTLSLLAVGVSQKEVITTPASFVATANAVIHAGGTPRFADISASTNTIDPDKVKGAISQATKAVIPVHLYGYPADMERLCSLAEQHDLLIVEDACQAHGATYNGRKTGTFGKAGCFSFYPSKNITVGGDGGMVVTDDSSIAEIVASLRDSGRAKGSKYDHVRLGFTERMNTVQAAIGRVQLKRLNGWNEKRLEIAKLYDGLLSDIEEVDLPPRGNDRIKPVHYMYVIRASQRDRLMKWLNDEGIECGVHYPVPIHLQPIYRKIYQFREGQFPNSERLCRDALSIPIYPGLSESSVRKVSEQIHRFYAQHHT